MPHPRDREGLARHALEQRLRRDRAAKTGRALESLDRDTIWRRAHGRCTICGRAIPRDSDWHEEHAVPIAAGGANDYNNVGPAHPTCNLEKGTGTA